MMAPSALQRVPSPINEPVREYRPGSNEVQSVQAQLKRFSSDRIEIPCMIGGKEIFTGNKRTVVMPHQHRHAVSYTHLTLPTR